MTPIELTARREALGFNALRFAGWLGVARSTASQWESGLRRIPGQVEEQVGELEDRVAVLVAETVKDLTRQCDAGAVCATAVTFRDDDALWAAHPRWAGMPAVVHRVALARALTALGHRDGLVVRLIEDDAGAVPVEQPDRITAIEAMARREALGLHQIDLARWRGLPQSAISQGESGKRSIPATLEAHLKAAEKRARDLTAASVARGDAHDESQYGAVVVHTYRCDEHLWAALAAWDQVPATLHRVAIAHARNQIARHGTPVRIEEVELPRQPGTDPHETNRNTP